MNSLFPEYLPSSTSYSITPLSFTHILPTKTQAQDIFWGLKDDFWKQIIDGKYHKYGPMVFDEALHKGPLEPGFFESLRKGCELASSHLTEKLTIGFYKELNKTLCSHFKGSKNNTEMLAEEAGTFRCDLTNCKPSLRNLNRESQENYFIQEIQDKYGLTKADSAEECRRYITKYLREYSPISSEWIKANLDFLKQENIGQILSERYPNAKAWVEKWDAEWVKKIDEMNYYISTLAQQFSVNKFASLSKNGAILVVDYLCISPREDEKIIQQLFDNYNQKMDEINLKLKEKVLDKEINHLLQEKIEIIANLFQVLEWLHPFKDGQGRTDLVLLAKLLSEEGLNPAILEEPYTSTWSKPFEWKDYLSRGIELWRSEKARH